ncbi:MAG: single-stranded DNA-binding protein [Actinomycetaceae bacterium]|nr:single-stranded DNA-binding protein [Actinomycetaceae bacterium]
MTNENYTLAEKPATETATVPVKPIGKIHPSNSDALNIVMRGRVGTTVEYSTYPSGAAMAKFRLAVSRKGRDDAGQWHDLGVTWYSVRMWGKLADNASRSLRKGEPVIVSGRLEVNQWTNESSGQKGMELVVIATSVGHDLNFGMAFFNKPAHQENQLATPGTSANHQLKATGENSANEVGIANPGKSEVNQSEGTLQGNTLAEPGEEMLSSEELLGVESAPEALIA